MVAQLMNRFDPSSGWIDERIPSTWHSLTSENRISRASIVASESWRMSLPSSSQDEGLPLFGHTSGRSSSPKNTQVVETPARSSFFVIAENTISFSSTHDATA